MSALSSNARANRFRNRPTCRMCCIVCQFVACCSNVNLSIVLPLPLKQLAGTLAGHASFAVLFHAGHFSYPRELGERLQASFQVRDPLPQPLDKLQQRGDGGAGGGDKLASGIVQTSGRVAVQSGNSRNHRLGSVKSFVPFLRGSVLLPFVRQGTIEPAVVRGMHGVVAVEKPLVIRRQSFRQPLPLFPLFGGRVTWHRGPPLD